MPSATADKRPRAEGGGAAEPRHDRRSARLGTHTINSAAPANGRVPGAAFAGPHELRAALRRMLPDGAHRAGVCGLFPVRGRPGAMIREGQNGQLHFAGLTHCGSVHVCPVCGVKIRHGRGQEIAAGLRAHLSAGGVAIFTTFTMSHHAGQRLADVWSTLADAWSHALSGRRRARLRDLGLVGYIRATEVTVGPSGWHPHAHVALLFDRDLDLDGWAAVYRELRAGWRDGLARRGARSSSLHGIGFETIRDEAAIGAYLSTVNGTAAELSRADAKAGRAGNRAPWQVLTDFARDGLAEDWTLYRDWIDGSRGRRSIEWSRGLRARLLGAEDGPSDDELAAETSPGRDVCRVSPLLWQAITRRDFTRRGPTLSGRLLAAVAWGGILAGLDCLAHAGIVAVARGPTHDGAAPVLVLLVDGSATAAGRRPAAP